LNAALQYKGNPVSFNDDFPTAISQTTENMKLHRFISLVETYRYSWADSWLKPLDLFCYTWRKATANLFVKICQTKEMVESLIKHQLKMKT